MSLHIQNGAGYADVYKGMNIVARIWDNGNGGHLVKVYADGYDATVSSTQDALKMIAGRLEDE